MHIKEAIQRLHSAEVSLDEIINALNHPYFIMRGNALLALGRRLHHSPEIGTDSLVERLESLLSDDKRYDLVPSISELAYCCLLKIDSAKAKTCIEAFEKSLPEGELASFRRVKEGWDKEWSSE